MVRHRTDSYVTFYRHHGNRSTMFSLWAQPAEQSKDTTYKAKKLLKICIMHLNCKNVNLPLLPKSEKQKWFAYSETTTCCFLLFIHLILPTQNHTLQKGSVQEIGTDFSLRRKIKKRSWLLMSLHIQELKPEVRSFSSQ